MKTLQDLERSFRELRDCKTQVEASINDAVKGREQIAQISDASRGLIAEMEKLKSEQARIQPDIKRLQDELDSFVVSADGDLQKASLAYNKIKNEDAELKRLHNQILG